MPCAKGKADSMNVYYLIRYLCAKGHQVHLVTYSPQEIYELDNLEEMYGICKSVNIVKLSKQMSYRKVLFGLLDCRPLQVNYYYYEKFEAKVKAVVAKIQPDCIYAHLIRTAEFLKDIRIPKLLAMINGQSLNYKRLIAHDKNIFRLFLYSLEYWKVRNYEPNIARKFDKVTLISNYDKQAIDPDNQLNNIVFCPNGIDVDYYAESLGVEKKDYTVVINGDFGTPTNILAATYFVKEIFPLIQAKIKNSQVVFVGRDSDKNLRQFAAENVTLTGRVEDIRPYVQGAQVAINPVKIAAGMQNKTLVSMASGLPVVSTSIANEGIQAVPDEEILIADTPQEFSDAVLRLFTDADLHKKIAKGGYQFVREKWNLEVHHARLEGALKSIIKKPAHS